MMSNEEWDRKIEFLLNQQAQFDIEMRRLEAAQARTEESIDRAAKNISHLAGFIHEGFGLVMNSFKETDVKIQAQHEITEAKIQELTESQKLTDEALRKLITRFDRHLSEDHPGLEN
jgi:plasmid maintenance system antidote protein VapI